LQAGLVELIKPEGLSKRRLTKTRKGKGLTGQEPPAIKRSVIERLITRIKRI